MNTLSNFQATAAAVALNKMFSGTHFSICDLDKLASLIGVQLGGLDYQALHNLHCVKWSDMPPMLREQVREKSIELLGLPPEIIDSTAKREPEVPQPSAETRGGIRLAFWKPK